MNAYSVVYIKIGAGMVRTCVYRDGRLVIELISACKIPKAEAIAEAKRAA